MQIPIQEIINILITGTVFLVILSGFVLLMVQLYAKAKRNYILEKENLNKEIETQMLQTQLEIQEQTLEKISQEIHDNIGQTLSFVKLSMNTININNTEQTESRLTESKELITKAIHDLRNLSKSLNTDFIKETGLIASIHYLLSYLEKTGAYATHFTTTGTEFNFKPDTEIILFRIIQELLNNIVKHAMADKVTILLAYAEEALSITVADNGKGFDPKVLTDKPQSKGLGLSNMPRRLNLIQATINIDSSIGKGTQALIVVPNQ